MSRVKSITLNGVTTTSPILVDCDLVKLLSEDCGIKEHIHLEHPSFTPETVRQFFTFGCIWNQSVSDVEMSTMLVDFLRIANYLGCSESVHQTLASQMNSLYKLDYGHDAQCSRVMLNCARFYIESTPPIRKTLPSYIMNMSRELCHALLDSGDSIHEELIKFSPSHRMFPLVIPQPHKDAFYKELNEHKAIVECVNKVDKCYIVGGYIVNCMKDYIMDGRNPIDDDMTVSDIDVFCLSKESLLALLRLLKDAFDCRVFVRHSVITVFIRQSPVQVQLLYMNGCIDDVMKGVDLPCSTLAYRNGVLLAPKSFYIIVDNDWCVDLDMNTPYYNPSRLAKYSNRGFIMKDYEFVVPKLSRSKWYTWTNETDDELLAMVKMVYDYDYEVFDDIDKLARGSVDSYIGQQNKRINLTSHECINYTSHKFKLVVGSNTNIEVELILIRLCKVPTYVLKDVALKIYTVGGVHCITLNDETKKNLDVIGRSMLKQVPACDAYIIPMYMYTNWSSIPDVYQPSTLWITASRAVTADGRTVLAMEAYVM